MVGEDGVCQASKTLTYRSCWRRRLIQREVPEEDDQDRSDDYRLSGRTWAAKRHGRSRSLGNYWTNNEQNKTDRAYRYRLSICLHVTGWPRMVSCRKLANSSCDRAGCAMCGCKAWSVGRQAVEKYDVVVDVGSPLLKPSQVQGRNINHMPHASSRQDSISSGRRCRQSSTVSRSLTIRP